MKRKKIFHIGYLEPKEIVWGLLIVGLVLFVPMIIIQILYGLGDILLASSHHQVITESLGSRVSVVGKFGLWIQECLTFLYPIIGIVTVKFGCEALYRLLIKEGKRDEV